MNFSKITPLGRADKLLKEQIPELDEEKSREYEEASSRYRRTLMAYTVIKILLYASIVTSVAANIGLNLDIISQVSSYIGVTFLLIIYMGLTYLKRIYREEFYVRREILVSKS